MNALEELRREVFARLLDLAGRVYIHVMPSEHVIIGRRGFKGQEQEDGIILVFNRQMKYHWHDGLIEATMSFGGVIEKCTIPVGEIIEIFSPDLGVQMILQPSEGLHAVRDEEDVEADSPEEGDHRVIQVDFTRREEPLP
jgi:hypothetical protein